MTRRQKQFQEYKSKTKLTHLQKNSRIKIYEIDPILAQKEEKEEKTRFFKTLFVKSGEEGIGKKKKKGQKTINRLIEMEKLRY